MRKVICNLVLGLQDNLSAIDILAACNLVNYFGKVVLGGTGVGQIALNPILLRKVSLLCHIEPIVPSILRVLIELQIVCEGMYVV